MSDEKSLTPQEVADMLKVAKTTVYEMIKRGEIPCYHIGRKVRVEYADLLNFRQKKKSFSNEIKSDIIQNDIFPEATQSSSQSGIKMVIAGQDISLDILCRHIESRVNGIMSLRSYISSYNGLVSLYRKEIDIASVHLWDEKTASYNIPYVRYLMPGIPCTMIHIVERKIGFYVKSGNPKKIESWQDFSRKDILMVNREKGSGVRILTDQKLAILGISPLSINGYSRESQSHLAAASIIAQGGADIAVGNEKSASQTKGIDFIPIQNEKYEIVIRKEDFSKPQFRIIPEILLSETFKNELKALGEYDLSATGKITNIG